MVNVSNNVTISNDMNALHNTSSNIIIPLVIVASVIIGIILISIFTYILKIKGQNKSKKEKNHLNNIFKKTYINSKTDYSSFSMKFSNMISNKNSICLKSDPKINSNLKVITFRNTDKNSIIKFSDTEINPIYISTKNLQVNRKKILSPYVEKITTINTNSINVNTSTNIKLNKQEDTIN